VFKAVSFKVTWTDVNLILAELRDDPPDALNAPLLSALLAASTRLDLDAARLVGGRYEQTTDLRLPEKHAQPFREWLDRRFFCFSLTRGSDQARAVGCSGPTSIRLT
jgi:hypothetical protein